MEPRSSGNEKQEATLLRDLLPCTHPRQKVLPGLPQIIRQIGDRALISRGCDGDE